MQKPLKNLSNISIRKFQNAKVKKMILKLNCGIKQLKTERDKLKTESYGKDNIKKALTDAAARRDGNQVANTIDQKLFVIKIINR